MRRGTRLTAHTTGGKQERNRRAGTENVPAIVGLGAAARRALDKGSAETDRVAALRDRLERGTGQDVTTWVVRVLPRTDASVVI